MVKNRCKNGDHYWVDAYVTPIMRDGEILEHQSVRRKPRREWIQRAEETYRSIRESKPIRALRKTPPLRIKLLLAFLLALAPLLAVMALLPQPSTLAIAGATVLAMGIAYLGSHLVLAPLDRVVEEARRIFDNPLMRYVYTGRTDEIGQLHLALKMVQSELGAAAGRMGDVLKNLSAASTSTAAIVEQTSQGMMRQTDEISQVVTP